MELEPLDDDGRRWRVHASGGLRMLEHGYQSWSATSVVDVASHVDPSLVGPTTGGMRASQHADHRPARPGEVRSELVTLLADDDGQVVLGADGGDRHDTTFRLLDGVLSVVDDAPSPEVRHEVRAFDSLDAWAEWAGTASGARVDAPFQVGWCSWYQYFHDVTEADVRSDLALAGDWPFDVFQLDDGYQAAIGDWLLRAPTFPTPLESLAADVEAAGFTPGLWIAPFLAHPGSVVATEHPDWLVARPSDRPMVGTANPAWGGPVGVLDTTHPEVQAHLEALASTLVAMGWRYLKLDFTYAPSFEGRWHDPTPTPAARVRAGFDAVRRGAGDDTFLLGCGAPIGACIGVVDGMRIGPDVAPWWDPRPSPVGYEGTLPSVGNALRNTEARQFQHRRLWLNDPDCVLLRTTDTELTPAEVDRWAEAVGMSGGMVLVSDDLSLLGADARSALDDVLATARAADAPASAR